MHPPSIFVVYYIFCPPPWPDAKKNHCYDFRHTGGILRSKIFRVGIQFLAPISIFRGLIHWVTGVLLTHFQVLYLISHCVTPMGLIRWVTVGATYRDNWEVGSDFHLMKKNILQISAFFLFSNFRKRQIALFTLSVGWSVG